MSILLREAYNSRDWVDLYSIHKRYLLSPLRLLEVCDELSMRKIIDLEGNSIRITDEGVRWTVKNRHSVFSSERPWARPSQHVTIPKRKPTDPYLPNLKMVERDFFLGLLPKGGD